jgi:hypothetical protein
MSDDSQECSNARSSGDAGFAYGKRLSTKRTGVPPLPENKRLAHLSKSTSPRSAKARLRSCAKEQESIDHVLFSFELR